MGLDPDTFDLAIGSVNCDPVNQSASGPTQTDAEDFPLDDMPNGTGADRDSGLNGLARLSVG